MNWKEYYKQHLMSAEDAVNHIQSGNGWWWPTPAASRPICWT